MFIHAIDSVDRPLSSTSPARLRPATFVCAMIHVPAPLATTASAASRTRARLHGTAKASATVHTSM